MIETIFEDKPTAKQFAQHEYLYPCGGIGGGLWMVKATSGTPELRRVTVSDRAEIYLFAHGDWREFSPSTEHAVWTPLQPDGQAIDEACKWIPVAERLPEARPHAFSSEDVYVVDAGAVKEGRYMSRQQCWKVWDIEVPLSLGPIPEPLIDTPGIYMSGPVPRQPNEPEVRTDTITHWMPIPAVPEPPIDYAEARRRIGDFGSGSV